MKVLYVSMYPTPAFPQKAIFCHEQVKALRRLGVDVTVVSPISVYDREVKTEEWNYENVYVRYIRYFKLPGARDYHKAGIALYRALERRFDLREYDIYHADASLPSGQAVMLASGKYGVPYVVHGHGLDVYLENSYRGYGNCTKIVAASKEVYDQAAAIIGVSRKVLDRIAEKTDITGKAFVAYNGVDTAAFHPVKHQNDKVRIISVGNLIPLKGHDMTIAAVRHLSERFPVQLEIVGRGPLETELKAQAVGAENITFSGYIPYHMVSDKLAHADIFVLPSWFEALGCVYLEAMACGIPVIGCWGNGIDEIITDGVDGCLIHNKAIDELEQKLELLMDRDTREQIGTAGCETVMKKYTWRDSAKTVMRIYGRVTEGA